MMMRQLLTATVLLLGTSVAAHATILASGSIYAGTTQTKAVCLVFNAGPAGSKSISFTDNQIIRNDGVNLAISFDDCGVLLPGQTCSIQANIVNNHAHSCKFVFPESKKNIRGVLEIRDSTNTPLQNTDIR